jgi:hypothetical protein
MNPTFELLKIRIYFWSQEMSPRNNSTAFQVDLIIYRNLKLLMIHSRNWSFQSYIYFHFLYIIILSPTFVGIAFYRLEDVYFISIYHNLRKIVTISHQFSFRLFAIILSNHTAQNTSGSLSCFGSFMSSISNSLT